MLAAKYDSVPLVVLGTTLGMMLANVPVVIAGNVAAHMLPLKLIRSIAAVIFITLGVFALVGNVSPSLG